ncbi:MAG: T9SS type A sorting domain-containing protein, partial [Melioribacteraceae bacterium]|nr:T9SS type A sorting domain-containing protein [Melioribacteraceae bacterium]
VSNESNVELSWTDNSNEEEGFIIERKENTENAEYIVLDTVAANQTSYTDTTDKIVSSYYYKVQAYNSSLNSEYTDEILVNNLVVVSVREETISNNFKLNQNYPNPFNPSTTISFALNEGSDVKLEIYDALGRSIKVLVDEKLSSGSYNIDWNSTNYAGLPVGSGIYIYKITANIDNKLYSESKKMILVK